MKTLVLTNHPQASFHFKKLHVASDGNILFLITSDSHLVTYKVCRESDFQSSLRYANTLFIPNLNDLLYLPNQILLLCQDGLFVLTDGINTLVPNREFITVKYSNKKIYLTEKVDDQFVLHQMVIRTLKDNSNECTGPKKNIDGNIFTPLNVELIEIHRSKRKIFIEHAADKLIILSDHLLFDENRFEWNEGSVLSFRLIEQNIDVKSSKDHNISEQSTENDFILNETSSDTALDGILNKEVLKKSIYGTILTSTTLFLINLSTMVIVSKIEIGDTNLVDHVVLNDKIIVNDMSGRIYWINLMNTNSLEIYKRLHLYNGPAQILKMSQSHVLTVRDHIYHIYFSNTGTGSDNKREACNPSERNLKINQTDNNSLNTDEEFISDPMANQEVTNSMKKNKSFSSENLTYYIAETDDNTKPDIETCSDGNIKANTRMRRDDNIIETGSNLKYDNMSTHDLVTDRSDANTTQNTKNIHRHSHDWYFHYFSDVDMVRKSKDILLIFSNKSINFYTIREDKDNTEKNEGVDSDNSPGYKLGIEYLFKLSLSGIVLQSFIEESFFTCQIGNICKLFSFHLANKFECMKIKEWPCLLHTLFNQNGVIFLQYLGTDGSIFEYNVVTGEEKKLDQRMSPLQFTELANKKYKQHDSNIDSSLTHLQIRTRRYDTLVNYRINQQCYTIKRLLNKYVLKTLLISDPIRSSLILMTEDKLWQIREMPKFEEESVAEQTRNRHGMENRIEQNENEESYQHNPGEIESELVPSFASAYTTLGRYLLTIEYFKGYLIVIKNEKEDIVGKWGRK